MRCRSCWPLRCSRRQARSPGSVREVRSSRTLTAGPPPGSAVTFETDMATLRMIDSGQWNAMTAMAQGRSDDPTPMTAHYPEGFA
jgi:hypothetical protein